MNRLTKQSGDYSTRECGISVTDTELRSTHVTVKIHKLYCLFSVWLFGRWLVTPLVTIMDEVTDFAAGIAFLRGSTPSAIVQVTLIASEVLPTVLSGLSGACSLFVTSNKFVCLSHSF